MKSKTLILMFVAIGCGLVASYMTSRVIADRGKDSEEEKVTVLVARQNLTMGTLIKEPEKLFQEKQFTKGEEPRRAITSFDQLKDQRLNKPLSAEQFVTPDDLMDKMHDGFAASLTPGKRAVALKVNAEGSVAGFVLPHSRVDIISVIRQRESETVSRIILQNVLVLAVDQAAQRPDDKQAVVSSTVTVEVSPEEAQRLALATDLGTLRLILRSFGDEDKVTTAGTTPKDIFQNRDSSSRSDDTIVGGNEAPPTRGGLLPGLGKIPEVPAGPAEKSDVAKAEQAPPPPPKTHTLTIYNGESLTKAVFTEGESNTQIEKSQPTAAPRTAAKPPAGKP